MEGSHRWYSWELVSSLAAKKKKKKEDKKIQNPGVACTEKVLFFLWDI